MTFYEIKELLNDNTIIKIYDGLHNQIITYDGKENIPEYFDDYEVNDIFSDRYHYSPVNKSIEAIGIELKIYKYEGGIYNE